MAQPLPRIAALGALLFAFLIQTAVADDRFGRQVNFDIAAQSVEAALLEFSKQADVQVMVGTLSLNGQKSEGVKGKLSVTQALEQLLKDTGLEYEAKGNTVTVKSVKNARANAVVMTLADGVRLASSDARGEAARNGEAPGAPASEAEMETLDEVVVTGTHIRGGPTFSPVLTFTDVQIQETGFATLQDWLDTLPQNFSSLPNEEGGGVGNFNRGTAVNLRGLGAGATLVLINGRRQSASGLDGDFVDISAIPTSAIDRVEVLTDGASALYGSDAIGGVVNIVLRKDYEGAETRGRFASAKGSVDETVVSQILGTNWSTGNVLLNYQHYERSALHYEDRDYTASADKTSFGGTDFRPNQSNPGNILAGAQTFPIPRSQDGTALEASDLQPGPATRQNFFQGAQLLPRRRLDVVYVTGSQRLTESVELFAEARHSERRTSVRIPARGTVLSVPNTNPFYVNPTGGTGRVPVAYSFLADLGNPLNHGETKASSGVLGTTIQLGGGWQAAAAGNYGEEKLNFRGEITNSAALAAALADPNPTTAFNPFGDGSHTNPQTLAGLIGYQLERSRSTMAGASISADGPLFALPAGEAKLALGADYRDEDLRAGVSAPSEFGRQVRSAYAEVTFPILGSRDTNAFAPRLELSAAGRFEEYSDFGETLNPKVGLRFSPFEHVSFRANWGTSFRAPKLIDLDESPGGNNFAVLFPLPDPVSPTGSSLSVITLGNNSRLKEETASTWSAGLDLKFDQGWKIALTYFDIDYKDRIQTPGPSDTFSILLQEQQWADIIKRNPDASELAEACSNPGLIVSRDECIASAPTALIDLRLRNIASTRVSGIDAMLDKQLRTGLGDFSFGLNGTYMLGYDVRASSTVGPSERVDTVGFPTALRLRLSAGWSYAQFQTSLTFNHTGDYVDSAQQPNRKVDSWNTIDARASYNVTNSSAWFDGLEFALSASNLFDEEPPFVNNTLGYDAANATALGRFIGFQISKQW